MGITYNWGKASSHQLGVAESGLQHYLHLSEYERDEHIVRVEQIQSQLDVIAKSKMDGIARSKTKACRVCKLKANLMKTVPT